MTILKGWVIYKMDIKQFWMTLLIIIVMIVSVFSFQDKIENDIVNIKGFEMDKGNFDTILKEFQDGSFMVCSIERDECQIITKEKINIAKEV